MNWVLEHLQILIGAAAAIAYLLNRGGRAARGESTGKPSSRDATSMADADQAERTRRVQEEIRRKIAERRAGEAASSDRARTRERLPPLVRPTEVPPIDPFGGPMRRILKEIETAAEKRLEPEPEPPGNAAVLVRQEKLAEEMRALEAMRLAERRRAAAIAAVKREELTIASGAASTANELRAQLHDPRELRRAFLLREVIGPPVALR